MAELESLVFSVDTAQLDSAQKKIEALAGSVSTLEQATTHLSSSDAASTRAAADSIKAKAELTRANTALARAEEAAAKAANDSSSAIKSSATATEASTKALAGAADNTSKIQKLLQNLSNTYGDLGNSMTRGESSIMNAARNFGASAAELEQVRSKLKDIGTLTKNPFDASLGAVRSITQELQAMQARLDPLNKDLFLTSKQLAEYSRLSAEATSKVVGMKLDPNSAAGLAKVNELLSASQQEYRKTAAELNKLVAQESAQNTESKKLLDSQANIDKSNNDILASTKRLADITALVTSGMSKEEAQMRVNLAARGVTVDNIEAQIVAEKNLAAAIASKGGALRQSTSDMVDYIAKLEDRTKRDVLAEKYISTYGTSRATANMAARAEMEKVPEDVIKSFIDRANAVDKATKASTGHANALKQVADEEARMVSALHNIAAAQGAGIDLTEKAAVAIANYEKNLKAAGIAGKEYSDRVAIYTKQQQTILKNDQEQQTKYLQRALQPQATDIFMGLATGQPIMTTLMQQSGQIADQMALAGVASNRMGQAMAAATTGMVRNLGQVALAVGQVGAAITKNLVVAFAEIVPDFARYITALQKAKSEEATFSDKKALVTAMRALGSSLTAVGAAAGVAVGAMAVGFGLATAEQDKLAVSLAKNGAAMGLTFQTAMQYATSMQSIGITTGQSIEVITAMSKSGSLLAEDIATVTKSAVDLQKYGGVAIEDTVAQYAKIREKPVEALYELAKATGLIPPEIVALVRELENEGRVLEATSIAMGALDSAHKQSVDTMKQDLSAFAIFAKETWGELKELFSNVFKGAWYKSSAVDALKEQRKEIAKELGYIEQGKSVGLSFIQDPKREEHLRTMDALLLNNIRNLNIEQDLNEQNLRDSQQQLSVDKIRSDLVGKLEDKQLKASIKKVSLAEYQQRYVTNELAALGKKYVTDEALLKTDKAIVDTLKERAKLEWESANKAKTGRTPREVLNKPSNVDLQENKKSYESAIRLAEEFGKNERAILKNNYEAGLVERGAYIARDLALIIAGEQQRRQAIEAETVGLTQDYEKKRIALEAEAKRLKASTLKGAPEQYQKVERALSDLSKQQETFNVLQGDKTAKLENEINLRYSETLKESNLAMVALNKSYTDFVKKQDDLATQRKDQIASTNTLMTLTGAEAAAYKAGADSVKQMTDELSKFKNDAKEADKVFSDFIANTKPSDFDNEAFLQRYMLLLKQKQNAATKVDEAIAKSGEYVEKAKTDAVTMYYQEEVKRISEGLSGVLTTAVFDGGEAGAKALRSFIEQELRKKFMIEIQANLVTPLVNQAFASMGFGTGATGGVGGMQMPSFGNLASTAPFANFAMSDMGSKLGLSSVGPDAVKYNVLTDSGELVSSLDSASAAFSYASAVFSASEGKWGQAAGQALGQWFGGPLGSAIGGKIGEMVDSAFAGETRKGTRYETSATGVKRVEGPSGGAINRYTEEQLNKQAFTSINNFLKNIGSKDFLTQFVSGIETSDNGKGGAFAGGTLSSGAKFGDTQSAAAYQFNENLSADDAMKRYTEEMNKVTIAALQAATDVPEYIAKAIADLDVEKLTAEQADAVVKDVQEMFTAMKTANKYMRDFGATLFEATEKGALSLSLLTSEFGGLEQFNSAMQTFSSLVSSPFQQALSNYTELRTAIDELGIELPYSAEGIRQLTNGLDLNTEAGRKAYASTIQAGSAMIQAGDTLLQTIGTSTEELAGIIVEGMRNGDPAGAGQYFADTVVYGIENALYQNMGSQITQIITNGIITPLMQSMIAGETAATAISKLSIAGITSQVQQVTTFFRDLFTDPEFIKIMDAMKTGLASVVTGFASDIPAPSFKEPVNPWKESDKAAKDAEDAAKKAEEAAKKAAEEWAKLLETLNDRKLTAEIKNIYLTQGNAAGLAAERAKELTELTKGLTTEQTNQVTSIYKSITALEDLNKGIEDLTSSFSSAIGSLASAAQKESMGYVDAIKTLSKYGITADKQSLLQYSNAQLLEFVSSISQIGGISAESRAEIIKTVSAIGELNTTFRNQAEQDAALMTSLLDAQGQNYEAGRKAVQVLAKMGTTIPKTTTELRYLLAKMSAAELQSLKFTDSLDGLVPAMKQLEKSIYSVFGLTEETITGVLQGILTGETKGIAAGQALGDAVYNGIKSVIATTGSQAVAQVFMQYILNPIVEAMLAGSTLSEAMNSVDVANGMKTAKDVASVYKEILGSTDIQQFAQIFFDAGNSLAETSDKSSSSFTDLESTLLGSDKAAKATSSKIDTLTSSITSLGNAAKSAVPQSPVKAPVPQETLPAEVVKTINAVVTDVGATAISQGDPALIVDQLKAYFATAPSSLEIYKGIKATGVSYDLIAQALGTTTETVAEAVKNFAETVVSTRSTNTNLEYLNAAGEVVKSILKEQPSQPNTATPVSGTATTYQPSGGYIPNRDLAGEEQKRNEGLQLQADLLRLQNKEQEALAIEYKLATVNMQPLVRELYDYNLELQKQITVLTQRKELESELLNLLGDTTELRKREMLTIDESNRSLKQLIWNLEDAKSATDKALENLKTLSDKLITELEKTFETTDNAYSALERALEAQKVAAEKQVEQSTTVRDNLKNIFEFLKDQVRELRGEVEQTKLMQAAEGRSVIRSAIGTGVIPEQKALEEAVAAARRGVEDQVYATKFERDRSYLLLANELDALKTGVEPQLTDAEKALEVANLQLANSDELLKKYKDQIDVMRGVDISVLTVDQSIAKLETAIQAEALARDQITEIKLQVELAQKQYDSLRGLESGVTTMTQAIVNMQNAIVAELQATSAAKKLVGGAVVNQDLGTTWIDKVPGMSYTLPSGTSDTSTQPSAHSAIVAGWSASQFAEAASGIASGTLAEAGTPVYEAIVNDPRWTGAYAGGGYNPGGIALVGEEGPELVNFSQPGQIFTAGQTRQALGTDNSELVDEIRNLREENKAQAGAIVRLQSQMLKLISRWDGNGLPETRPVV